MKCVEPEVVAGGGGGGGQHGADVNLQYANTNTYSQRAAVLGSPGRTTPSPRTPRSPPPEVCVLDGRGGEGTGGEEGTKRGTEDGRVGKKVGWEKRGENESLRKREDKRRTWKGKEVRW